AAVNDARQPLTLTIRRDGQVFIQETPIALADLTVRLKALAGDGYDRPIYVRADGGAPYSYVAQVMARLSTSGFTKIDLITDTGAPLPA
ncbi:biopolymer transporter ExbD, partial [Acinetobacter baumannii]